MQRSLTGHSRQSIAAVVAALTFGVLHALVARAEGVFVSSPNRVDVAYDDARGVLYISDGPQLTRFQLSTRTLLTPITLGGSLSGMDISPDGAFLVVADRTPSGGQPCLHIVDLAALTTQSPCFSPAFAEGGSFTAAYGSDGSILVSSQFQGSGTVPLRRYVPSTGTVTTVATSVQQNTMLRANADHSVIALAESNSSDGPFDSFAVATGVLTRKSGYTNGTSWFNYEIAVSPDAQQYAIPTYGGTFLTDSNLTKLPTIVGTYAAGQPVGVAYNPINNSIYFPWAGTSRVYVYDRTTLAQTGSLNLSGTFGANGNFAFVNGRVKTSNDGRLLFVTVDGGVRYLTLDRLAPTGLTAAPHNASVNLAWSAVPNAISYNVYQGTLAGAEATIPIASGVTGTAVSVAGLTNGTTYYFTVAAVTASGTSTPSDEASATPMPPPPAVSGLRAVAGNGQVTLAWTALPTATSYTVYQGAQPGGESAIATGLTTANYTASNVTNGTTYYFQVAASNLFGTGLPSSEVSATPLAPPAPPAGLVATAGDGTVTLQWSAAARAASYSVFVATTPGNELSSPPIGGLTGTSISLSSLTNGQTYFFVVTSVNTSGQSTPSNEASATPLALPGAVEGLVARAGTTQVALSWQAAVGATTYDVYEGTSAGAEGSTPIQTVRGGTSANLTGLTNGTTYYFEVTARNASGAGPSSRELSATPIAATALSASAGYAQVALSWDSVDGASGYAIYQGTSIGAEGAQPAVIVANATSITVSGLTNGTHYYFTATALNASGESARSNEVSATPASSGGGGATDPILIVALASLASVRFRRMPVHDFRIRYQPPFAHPVVSSPSDFRFSLLQKGLHRFGVISSFMRKRLEGGR